ncbi:MAG: YicC/YloC family endoribonuclease [Gemmataceae bacterium]
MLYSMTGYGEASYSSDEMQLAVELRAVNNRYLKVTLRANEPYNLLEPEVEKVIRRLIRRGTIQVHLRCQRKTESQDYPINTVALRSYLQQLKGIASELGTHEGTSLLGHVLALPGVVPEPNSGTLNFEEEWPTLEKVLEQSLERLQRMRQEEGRAMAQELLQLRDSISRDLGAIRQRIPTVAEAYRDRMFERVKGLLGELDVQIDRKDLIKEVAIFADRADISEEVVRLASHLDQFQDIIAEPESSGRKLEFLTQEMFRETNTIGSKASDVEISRHVVAIKGTLEKIRELVQNIE